jgi:alginate O-acetyltransferase complex protein AlgI
MVFSSPGFLFIFLPAFFALYVLFPLRFRNGFALVGSAAFYALGAGGLIVVVSCLIAFNWLLARLLATSNASRVRGDSHAFSTTVWLCFGVAANLLPLVFFKYAVFLNQLLIDATGFRPWFSFGTITFVLPLGISFYTFHCISYLVDVYRRQIKHEARLSQFALYIFLFPHLIAGPIVRYSEIKSQLDPARRRLVEGEAFWGLLLFIVGLGKKILFADPLGDVVDTVHANDVQLSTYSAWLAAFCYSFQIYFDFSGYTDMALGLARIMGIRFPHNFARPYCSASITEFWRRWHMTLSRWFRDYLYIPLGGNRGSAFQTYRNLVIVFALCGLWHGAAYTFLIWGLAHGLLLVLERAKLLRLSALPFAHVIVFAIVTVLWVPFRAHGVGEMQRYFHVMLGLDSHFPVWIEANRALADWKILFLLVVAAAVCLLPDRSFAYFRRLTYRHPLPFAIYALLIYVWSCLSVVEAGFNPFIYFAF